MGAILNIPEDELEISKQVPWKEGDEAWIYSTRDQAVIRVNLMKKLDDKFWRCGVILHGTIICGMPHSQEFIVQEEELCISDLFAVRRHVSFYEKRLLESSRLLDRKRELDKLDPQNPLTKAFSTLRDQRRKEEEAARGRDLLRVRCIREGSVTTPTKEELGHEPK